MKTYKVIRVLLFEAKIPIARLADVAGYNREHVRQVLRGIRRPGPAFRGRVLAALASLSPHKRASRPANGPEAAISDQERRPAASGSTKGAE
jgi:hypothetical protein